MSGGSYDYCYCKVEDIAYRIEGTGRCTETKAARAAFAAHLRLVANALHAIEWVDSCDYSSGDELAPIRACLASGAEVEYATQAARETLEALERALAHAESRKEQS